METGMKRLTLIITEISDDDDAARVVTNRQIEAFAGTLEPDAWFEVWYPGTTESDFDVVRVDQDGIHTLDVFEDAL